MTATSGERLRPAAPAKILLGVGWLLRVLAVLTLCGAIKLLLLAWSWPIGECLLVLLYGLTLSAVVWALGEIVLALHGGRPSSHR